MRKSHLLGWLVGMIAILSSLPAAAQQQDLLVMRPGETIRFRPSAPQRYNPQPYNLRLMEQPPMLYLALTNLLDVKGPLRAFGSLPGAEGQEDFLTWVALEHPEAGVPFTEAGLEYEEITDDLIGEVTARYLEPYLRALCDWEPFYEKIPAGNTWYADEGEFAVTETIMIAGVRYATEYTYTAPDIQPLAYPGMPPYYPLVPDHLITLTYFENGRASQVIGIQLDTENRSTDQDIPLSYVGPYLGYAIPQMQSPAPVQMCILASPMVPAAVASPSRVSALRVASPYRRSPSPSVSNGPKKRPWVGPAVGSPTSDPQYVGQTCVKSRGPYMAPGYPKKIVTDHVDVPFVEWKYEAELKGSVGIDVKVPLTYRKIRADFGVSGSLSPSGVLGFRYVGQVQHDEFLHIRVWWTDTWIARRNSSGILVWKLFQTSKWRQEGHERIYTPIWAATLMGWRPDLSEDGKRWHWPWENGNPYDPICIKWGAKNQYPLPRNIS